MPPTPPLSCGHQFGHRGYLAGAYHEFKRRGVLLSVYYPGSMETPGFKEEMASAPLVTAKVEGQCSDVNTADSAAEVLMWGISTGAREITNELLPALLVDYPTGSPFVDAAIAWVVALIRAGWTTYLGIMCHLYISLDGDGGESKGEEDLRDDDDGQRRGAGGSRSPSPAPRGATRGTGDGKGRKTPSPSTRTARTPRSKSPQARQSGRGGGGRGAVPRSSARLRTRNDE